MGSGFVHLHCHSNYSLLEGASGVGALLDAALEPGMKFPLLKAQNWFEHPHTLILLLPEKGMPLKIFYIVITAVGVAATFAAARAYMQEGRWARAGAIVMPVGLAAALLGALLLFIPDFFSAR